MLYLWNSVYVRVPHSLFTMLYCVNCCLSLVLVLFPLWVWVFLRYSSLLFYHKRFWFLNTLQLWKMYFEGKLHYIYFIWKQIMLIAQYLDKNELRHFLWFCFPTRQNIFKSLNLKLLTSHPNACTLKLNTILI